MGKQNITERFGKRLQELRKAHGWTQVEMADTLGIDRSYISDMECGKLNVCLPTLEVLAQGFHMKIAEILRDF